ncbi:1750_t:CDS:2 [Scutellospora calospora]|uniref:1750_t:CDS:1 n=1 Tax=Scutellospora calospora TaxID=85575 RepID=A0ACA9KQG0_9GLOM|nr:1750_t:CDS:2 [Scutellospora calospora]
MPPRHIRINHSKKSNKKTKPPFKYNLSTDYFWVNTLLISVPVKINDSGISFSVFIEIALIQCKANSKERNNVLDHNKIRSTKVLSNHLVALNAPPSMATMWFFGTTSDFSKDAEIRKVTFEYAIEYKELAPGANISDNKPDNDYSIYFENGEVVFKNYKRDLTSDIVIINLNDD